MVLLKCFKAVNMELFILFKKLSVTGDDKYQSLSSITESLHSISFLDKTGSVSRSMDALLSSYYFVDGIKISEKFI